MNKQPEKRQIKITNVKTGATRLSEPMPVQNFPNTADESPQNLQARDPSSVVLKLDEANAGKSEIEKPTGKKQKTEIETLEQFIAYVYSRKGQRAALSSTIERRIAKNPRLNDDACSRLMSIAVTDEFIAVPRQLLLVSREVLSFPVLKETLSEFVMNVMLSHPVFSSAELQAAIRNLPDAPSPAHAISSLTTWQPLEINAIAQKSVALKPSELDLMRRNARNLLAVWFFCHRCLSIEELSDMLMQSTWQQAGRELKTDSAKLRAMTDQEDMSFLGWIGMRWRQQLTDALQNKSHTATQLELFRIQHEHLKNQSEQLTHTITDRDELLDNLRKQHSQEITALESSHAAEKMHLSHEIEALRGRLLRRLNESTEMLEVGLSALKSNTPNIIVMVQRAEQVIDALRAELKSINGG